ncbi:unnamed protein product, partial [Heterosigma akashiwo]
EDSKQDQELPQEYQLPTVGEEPSPGAGAGPGGVLHGPAAAEGHQGPASRAQGGRRRDGQEGGGALRG